MVFSVRLGGISFGVSSTWQATQTFCTTSEETQLLAR
jgi:hypothetical protein